MNPETPTPRLADGEPVTPLARRVGPPVAAVSLLLTLALLVWLVLAPTAVAGPLADAPYTVPATLVVGPDDDGCLDLVAGDGGVTTHCLDELVEGEEEYYYTEASFDAAGDVVVVRETEAELIELRIEPDSGEVLSRDVADRMTGESINGEERAIEVPADDAGPVIPTPEQTQVYADGDVVRRFLDDPATSDADDPVVLDLDAPPGYRLRDAVLSPDGSWVVVTTPDDRVVVAPTDGSGEPYVWADLPNDRWVPLWSAIRWDG